MRLCAPLAPRGACAYLLLLQSIQQAMAEEACLDATRQSPTPTSVVSRFFNKEGSVPEGVKVDAPPPKTAAPKGRPRTTRSVGSSGLRNQAADIVSPEEEILAAIEETNAFNAPTPLTKEQQFACYLGNCAPLMLYARERYGDAGAGGITTRQVRAWLKANPEYIPEHLRGQDFHVDHVVGDGIGGHNWPLNYFLMPKAANLWFGGWLTIDKRRYVGMPAWTAATSFTTWCAQKSRATLPFGTFDPVSDKFLSKRGR